MSAPAVLFVDHTGMMGGAQHSRLDIAEAHRERGAIALLEDGPFAAALEARGVRVLRIGGGAALRRIKKTSVFPGIGSLTFEEPDVDGFPAVDLARRAGETCGTMPAVFNAANEIDEVAFVNGKFSFTPITELVRRTMDAHRVVDHPTFDQILEADTCARKSASA